MPYSIKLCHLEIEFNSHKKFVKIPFANTLEDFFKNRHTVNSNLKLKKWAQINKEKHERSIKKNWRAFIPLTPLGYIKMTTAK